MNFTKVKYKGDIMKRRLLWIALFYLLGIYTSLLYELSSVFLCGIVLLVALIFKTFVHPSKNDIFLAICIFFMFLGSFYISYENSDARSFIKNFKGQTVTLSARITDYPQKSEKYFSLTANAKVLHFGDKTYQINENVLVRLYDKECTYTPGDNVLLTAKVLIPISSENIAQNYALFLKTKKVYTILSVKSENSLLVSSDKRTFFEKLTILRRDLGTIVYKYLPEREAALLCGMLLGEREGIDEKTIENFSSCGLSHIIAVSGLHVNAICVALYLALGLFGISKKNSSFFVIAFLFIYVLLTGMSISCIRAAIMMLLSIISKLILKRKDALTSLAAAALVLTAVNPFYAFSVSFMLSFGATGGILLFAGKLINLFCRIFGVEKENKFLYKTLSSLSLTFSAQVICTPVILIYFGKVTLWTFYVNIMVIPLLIYLFGGGIVLILSYFIYSPAAKIATYFIYPLLKAILFIADFFGNSSGGIIAPRISKETILLYTIFMFLIYKLLSLNDKLSKRR